MPKQGQSVESCIITEIRKNVGDVVGVGDVLFAYETDKASFEEESKVAGTVLACFFKEGDEVPCLTNVMVIGAEGEEIVNESTGQQVNESTGAKAIEGEASPKSQWSLYPPQSPRYRGAETPEGKDLKSPLLQEGTGEATLAASPRARRLAEEKGVNIARIVGSGPHGRIIERDVEAAAGRQGVLSGKARAMMAAGDFEAPAKGSGLAGMVRGCDLTASSQFTSSSSYEDVPMTNMRKLIARAMYNSLQNSAQLTHHLGADARRMQALRKQAKKAYEEGRIDANITINDFVCYAVIRALQQFPHVNSHCLGESLRIFKKVNLGLAVDTERGLMVPTVLHADDLDIVGLSKALKKVADDCKKGSINPDLLSPEAASFTVSNLGNYGVEIFTPIINVPQSAILGVNTIVPRPKDVGGGVYDFVPYLGLSLTYDHRSIDGGEATRFLKTIANEIENLDVTFP